MADKISINEALVLGQRTPPRQMTGYKRKLIPDSPPDTTSQPKEVDLTGIEAQALAAQKEQEMWARAAQNARWREREDASKRQGGTSRRRKTKKGRKTRRRGGDPPNVVVSNPAWNLPKGKSKSVTGKGRKTHRRRK
jgi:hypothetical protein